MALATFYFQLHQPFRLHPDTSRFLWEEKDREIFMKVAEKNYLPATRMFTELVKDHPEFKITFSMSGTFLEQAELYQPEVITALRELLDAGSARGQVEYLEETYYHSLTALFEDPKKREFRDQVSLHREKMKAIFGIRPTSFRNTELMYNNEIAETVNDMGFKAILCEQRDDMLVPQEGRKISPHAVFRAKGREDLLALLVIPRNRHLSDDIAFRFKGASLTAEQYAEYIARIDGEAVMLGYDYEHIGEHLWEDTGIFEFWGALATALAGHPNVVMVTPTEMAERFKDVTCPAADIHPLATSSWADMERNTHGWLGNVTQYTLFREMERLEEEVRQAGGDLLKRWRYLTTSDHLYYLHEGLGADRTVHDYFSPYGSLATSTYLLTRNLDNLSAAATRFNIIRRETQQTPVIIITPETSRLPTEGMGKFAQFVSGKSGGLGEVVSALCQGLIKRHIPTHFITLNLRRRFREEARISDEEWTRRRHQLNPENVHLVSSSVYEDYHSVYDGDPIVSATEFQKQVVNTTIKEIRSQYGGRAILHTQDWMAGGAITAYARMRGIPVLHTVHNTHTAPIPLDLFYGVNMDRLHDRLFVVWEHGRRCLDAQATALKNATLVNYVGKRFLEELVGDYYLDRPIIPWSVRQETKAKYYNGLVRVVANGISPDVYPENQKQDPDETQPGLAQRYGPDDHVIAAKKKNLVKFQKQIGLRVDPEAILLYWPSRLDPVQKGVELLEAIAQKFVIEHEEVQIAVVGNPVGSDQTHREVLGRIACASGGQIAYHGFDEALSILGYAAASDVFGASLYEPFGQIDVVGNIYGATATNRDTGGYNDKIKPLVLKAWGAPQDRGNGVLFKNYDAGGLWWALERTVENHRFFRAHPRIWQRQLRRIMIRAREEWSLEKMVAGYITLYEELNGGKPLI